MSFVVVEIILVLNRNKCLLYTLLRNTFLTITFPYFSIVDAHLYCVSIETTQEPISWANHGKVMVRFRLILTDSIPISSNLPLQLFASSIVFFIRHSFYGSFISNYWHRLTSTPKPFQTRIVHIIHILDVFKINK